MIIPTFKDSYAYKIRQGSLFIKELNYLSINSRVDFEALVNHLNHDIYGEEHYKEELEVCEQVLTQPEYEEVKKILK